MSSDDDASGRCMSDAFLCVYTAYDCNNWLFCCQGATDCLCVRHSVCLALNGKPRGVGMTTDKNRGEICKVACYCCDLGLVIPTKICASASHCLCCLSVASLPCSKEYVPEPVCAYCFLQCLPTCGCCAPPPECRALDMVRRGELDVAIEEMDRGEVQTKPSEDTADTPKAPQEIPEQVKEEESDDEKEA